MSAKRTRFLIVASWPNGDNLEIESRKDTPLSIAELVENLRKYADTIEAADKVVAP